MITVMKRRVRQIYEKICLTRQFVSSRLSGRTENWTLSAESNRFFLFELMVLDRKVMQIGTLWARNV
ncbi:hypothetical protein GPL15_06680 [Clostridium sp. MCC353]|uniref:hypothetical protein n=1 Tax=Clostridium sp. MCC353 TaxID=2592646 RepID=UPI001C038D1D|nr:hypothetical protein [Clostridium sp. MCC353]MBT9776189.1 hypothetical protein [Clostridium sp. MCC353]